MNKKLAPYIILFLAVLLLAVDIRLPARDYPAFESFPTEAPETVDLVINHVIGHHLMLDLLPDVLGYVLLPVSNLKQGHVNKHFKKQY